MTNRNRQGEFSMKNFICCMIAPTLLLYGMEVFAGERGYTEVELLESWQCGLLVTGGTGCMASSGLSSVSARTDAAWSGTNQEALPRALQIEDPITSGTPFTWEDADKVQNGMTEAEVVAILGKPYSRSESGDQAILVWSYTSSVGGSNAVAYRFQNDRVVGSHRVSR